MAATTIVDFLVEQVGWRADAAAMRWRAGAGDWREITWRQYGEHVDAVGGALLAHGVGLGDRVGIMSANRPEWLFADLGAMGIGAATVPIYPTLIAQQALHPMAHSQMRVLFVGDAAQRDKVRLVRREAGDLELVVCIGCESGPGEIGWDDFVARGRGYLEAHPDAVARARAKISPDTMATIVYTSGTTGPPKGAMLSHRNMVAEADAVADRLIFKDHEETLSFLPLSHVAERLQGEIASLRMGVVVNFARALETVKDDLVEVRPTVLLCVPRLWEKIYEAITSQVSTAPAVKRALFGWALRVGREKFRRECAGRCVGWNLRAQAAVADRLVGSKLRRKLGVDRARTLLSGAAPLAVPIQEFFGALGMPILEAFGQTECGGVSHMTGGAVGIRPGTVGKPVQGMEVRLAADGEILLRGPSVFLGYFRDEAATREAVRDGWLHTGDVGEIDVEGYLRITDRKKDIIVTAGGKNVAPQNIENRLKTFPGISQVVVLGDKRKFLVALVTLDAASVGRLFGGASVAGPWSRNPAARAYVQAKIEEVNRELSSYETVKRFEILDADFSIESGELTPTMKVKRRVIDERYRHIIDGLFEAA